MKKGFYLIVCCLWVFQSWGQTVPELYKKVEKEKMNHWVDSIFDTLTLDERIGQLFMPVVYPTSDDQNIQLLTRYVNEGKIGGILFQKGKAITQAEITNKAQKISRVPMLISLDGEWGLSMRLEGTTRFPKNMMLGAIENVELIEAYGKEVGRQCREMGIHINFAPDLDVNSNVANPVIGIRSFGENPKGVAEKGVSYSRGIESMGIISVAKHFPGHGDTAEDSHHTLPSVKHNIERLDSVELYPFKQYIYEGFAGIMTGHLHVPALDKTAGLASSFSRPIVTELLKGKLGFQGLCFTDALAMKGASTKKTDNPSVKALLAGNDILLAPASLFTDIAAVKEALSEGILSRSEIEEKCLKILQYKYVVGLHDYKPIDLPGLSERLNSPHASWLVAKLNAEAITILKNENNILPIKGIGKKKFAALALGEEIDNDFHNMLNRYEAVDCYSLAHNASEAQIQEVYRKLESYDVIICNIHTIRAAESQALRQLATKKEVILTFFTLPYACRQYKASIGLAHGVVIAYESTPLAQEQAAQVIFGGLPAKGKIPVSIPDLYFEGTGIFTEKSRLGYHQPEEVGLNPTRLNVIESIIQEGLDEKAFPGGQLLVAKDGMIVYNKAFGHLDYDNKQPVTDETTYDLASVSKATGTLLAVMKAYDEKKFTLSDKISKHVSELKESDKKDIIIRDILYHQSGLSPSLNFYTKAIDHESYSGSLFSSSKKETNPIQFDRQTYVRNDFKFLSDIIHDKPGEGFTAQMAKNMYVSDTFADSIIVNIKESKLGQKGKYSYSCVNFILLKIMVDRLMNTTMDKLLEDHFFKPLGTKTTMYNPLQKLDISQIAPTENDQFLRQQLLRGYAHDEAAAIQGGVSGNAGLFSNAQDLAKILQLYLNLGTYGGETLLSKETTTLFTQNKSPNSRRGLGFDKPIPGHPDTSPCGALAPASVYGHTGYTGTCFWVDPDNHLIYILLTNRVYPSRINTKMFSLDIRTRIQDAIYKALEP